MAEPIIFTITEAGKQAALNANADSAQVKINLTQVAVGTAPHLATGNETALTSEVQRSSIVSGDIEVNSNTLRFTSSMSRNTKTDVYEVGLFTDDNVLFALASSTTDPLFSLHPNITFVISFGLSLSDVAADSITVSTDPNGALSVVIMENHLAALDPHPQYMNSERVQFLFSMLIPLGYIHHTHSPENPKPIFDEIMGVDTFWRRLDGLQLVGVDPNDPNISEPMLLAGKQGVSNLVLGNDMPDYYPLRTTYIWERYDPSNIPVRYDGQSRYDGQTSYL